MPDPQDTVQKRCVWCRCPIDSGRLCDACARGERRDLQELRELTLNWPGVDPRTGRFRCFLLPINDDESEARDAV